MDLSKYKDSEQKITSAIGKKKKSIWRNPFCSTCE